MYGAYEINALSYILCYNLVTGYILRRKALMEFTIMPYKTCEERYVADFHKKLYSSEYSWGSGFTDYATKIAIDFAKKEKNDREELFVAERGECFSRVHYALSNGGFACWATSSFCR